MVKVGHCAAGTVDSNLHEMMRGMAARDDSIKTELQEAVEMKNTFEADETALNKTICTRFKPAALAAMLGNFDDSDDDEAEIEESDSEDQE